MKRLFLLTAGVALAACGSDDSGGGPGGTGGAGGTGAFGAFGGNAGAAAGGGNAGQAGSGGATGGSAGVGGVGGVGATGGVGGSGGGAAALITALGKSKWSAKQTRAGKQRVIQMEFDAGSLFWAEVRNPFGPARQRRMRVMQIESDGQTVNTTVTVPAGWPSDPENGKKDTFSIKVNPGAPRTLEVTQGGTTETFQEGAWPAPSSGFTAVARVFATGGAMANAFCESGTFTAPNRGVIWNFARGKSTEALLGEDTVAGAQLSQWHDPTNNNQYAITDVPGFDQNGGTLLSDQFNFIVLYLGTVTHSGGSFGLREKDDDVRDGIWAFLGSNVGSSSTADVFLEVHGKATTDLTADMPSAIFPAQDLKFEAMLLRCNQTLQDIDVELNQGSWKAVSSATTKPQIDNTLFPPAL
jgi:hypothetical protein